MALKRGEGAKKKIERREVRGVHTSKGTFGACSGGEVSGGAHVPRGSDTARREPPPWVPALSRVPYQARWSR